MTMLGSPQVGAVATVNTGANSSSTSPSTSSQSIVTSEPTSNSTILDIEGSNHLSPNTSNTSGNLSYISPLKDKRENSMSSSYASSSSDVGDHNMSLFLKHNINAVNLDDPGIQRIALQYLLEKVRDIETLLIDSVKENKDLREEVSVLYHQNDALAAENVTLKDVIAKQGNDNQTLTDEILTLKHNLNGEKENLFNIFKMNCEKISKDMKILEEDIDYLDTNLKVVQEKSTKNSHDIFENYNAIIAMDKEIIANNQYNRRQNLIIDGIPDKVPQSELENVCLDIIHKIGFLPVGNYEVEACHRLKKRAGDASAPTIIRFVNRKITEYCIKNRWRLKNIGSSWNLSFREDLCQHNLAVQAECEKLMEQGFISKVYTRNGFVRIVLPNKTWPVRISYWKDIQEALSKN